MATGAFEAADFAGAALVAPAFLSEGFPAVPAEVFLSVALASAAFATDAAGFFAAGLVAEDFDAPEAFTGAFAVALTVAGFPAEAFPGAAFAAAGLADVVLVAAALPDVEFAGVDLEFAGFPAAGLDAAARVVVLRREAGFAAVFAAGFFGAPSLVSSVICVTPILSDMPPSPYPEGPAHWGILHTEKRTNCA
ncbi:hypothetical protein SIAM614_17344 [Stappia aggregata IAM 12614]|uniref:Uncharacterized protein n=1 Tax=Roseibium aggregatum (strain ATCC 25650 / DSM 13394 / JCM 20685 / NBRC 16684 / NCIMB 2208 / IAM 12614 / B1) TaxID=384765 RepID=A0P2D5_ROSAI|nr:hypothetical protein SIAM614_17344 [Stappia aggregata IAM 12614] [Roseibium aggregatum IAM 12614]